MTKNIPGFSWKQQKLQTFRASSKPTVSSWCWPRSLDILRTFSATQRFFFFAASSEVEATKSPLKTKVVSSRPDSETDKMGKMGCRRSANLENSNRTSWFLLEIAGNLSPCSRARHAEGMKVEKPRNVPQSEMKHWQTASKNRYFLTHCTCCSLIFYVCSTTCFTVYPSSTFRCFVHVSSHWHFGLLESNP